MPGDRSPLNHTTLIVLLRWPDGVGPPALRWPAALRWLQAPIQGSLKIPCIRTPPVKNARRPILRQLNNGPVAPCFVLIFSRRSVVGSGSGVLPMVKWLDCDPVASVVLVIGLVAVVSLALSI